MTGELTLAVDEAVTTDFLSPDEQPGVFVRRVAADRRELSDLEVLHHWREVFDRYPPGEKHFVWDFWIALHHPKHGITFTSQVEHRCTVSDRFSEKIDPGYPMSSFLMHEGSDKPYSELTDEERRVIEHTVFAGFLRELAGWIEVVAETDR